jgi:hypothetical protein
MPDQPQVPRIAQIVGPAKDAWIAARPRVLAYLNNGAGRYADIPAGWDAQVALLVRQIADEVASARLASSVGASLTQLAASEFTTLRNAGPTASVGNVIVLRAGGAFPGGVIPEGSKLGRPGLPTYTPGIPGAAYTTTRDVPVPEGLSHVDVPIVASLPGSASNAPYYDGDNTGGGGTPLAFTDTLFDPFLGVQHYEAAGGSDGEDDDDLKRQCLAAATGRFGPTIGAVIAAALSGIGVHRIACFDVAQALPGSGLSGGPMVPVAYTGVAIADQSWASGGNGLVTSTTRGIWEGLVGQVIAGGGQGVGGQYLVSGVSNTRIQVAAPIFLRSGDDLKDTSAVSAAVLAAARSYFDDRPDWYTWTLRGLAAAISRAHPKILSCPSGSLAVSLLATGAPLAPPTSTTPVATELGLSVTHYELAQNGVIPSYTAAT